MGNIHRILQAKSVFRRESDNKKQTPVMAKRLLIGLTSTSTVALAVGFASLGSGAISPALATCVQTGTSVICEGVGTGFDDVEGTPISNIRANEDASLNQPGSGIVININNNPGTTISEFIIDENVTISSGSGDAILLDNGVSNFTNNGTIEGGSGAFQDGIQNIVPTFTGATNILNNGTIRTNGTGGGAGAVLTALDPAAIINITNSAGAVIETNPTSPAVAILGFTGQNNIVNSGTISGGSDAIFTGNENDTINNSNVIQVSNTSAVSINDLAIETGAGDDIVINSGILRSQNGSVTVNLGLDDDTFEVRDGSQIFSNNGDAQGGVDGGDGIDVLRFGGVETQSFNLNLIGLDANQFQNFETFEVIEGETSFSGSTTETFTVQDTATLGGNGTFGGLSVNSGGTVTPGNSIGTITVDGDLTLDAGSTLVIEVSETEADQIIVNGEVDVTGATVQLDDLAPVLEDPSQTFVVIDNDGSDPVAGEFANIVDNLAFLTPIISTTGGTGNDVVVSFTLDVESGLPTIAATGNQEETAEAFSSLPDDDPNVQEINNAFLPLTVEQAQNGLNSLGSEVFGVTGFAINTNGLFVGSSIVNVLNGFGVADNARRTRVRTY